MKRRNFVMYAQGALALVACLAASDSWSAGDVGGRDPFACTPLPVVSVQALDANGQPLPGHDASAGSVTTFRLPDGSISMAFSPPPGFDPLSASDAALAAFHLPPRPADPAALRQWQQVWGQPLSQTSSPDRPCLSNIRS